MLDWHKVLIQRTATIRESIAVIDSGNLQIALVVDENRRLLGTVTDGDVRRAILRGHPMDGTVDGIMNRTPSTVAATDSAESVLVKMKQRQVAQIPVLDSEGRVVRLETLNDLIYAEVRPNTVVIMAGGLGSRLRPLTDDCPKPMLRVGCKPILETILDNFVECGFGRFYFAVNYMAETITNHFGDGQKWGVDIRYIREDKQLGTAGALGLLPEKQTEPLIVMNGDLLTKVNFRHLMDFHGSQQAVATMCVTEYDFQVPYGVVNTRDSRIISIEEKPVHRFFVNAGIYVINPAAVRIIPKGSYFDMPALFEQLIKNEQATAVFPIREYWLDIGHMDDFERANVDFSHVFPSLNVDG